MEDIVNVTDPEVKKEKNYVSFSEYSLFRSCPYKWYAAYILKEKTPTNEFLVFGKALHATIEQIVKEQPSKILYTKLFEKHLVENSNGILLDTYFGKGMARDAGALIDKLDYFRRFAQWSPIRSEDGKIISLEEEMFEPATMIGDKPLFFKGFIDYSAKHVSKDKYLVMDWKTGLKPWNLEKKVGTLDFGSYSSKLSDKAQLTPDESKDLEIKTFFGQTVLYKHFYAQKHDIDKSKIDIGYCVMTRQPVEVQEYFVEIQDSFEKYILKDFEEALIQIYLLKQSIDLGDIEKFALENKPKSRKSLACQYCNLKSTC